MNFGGIVIVPEWIIAGQKVFAREWAEEIFGQDGSELK